jgi:hypothetical protein
VKHDRIDVNTQAIPNAWLMRSPEKRIPRKKLVVLLRDLSGVGLFKVPPRAARTCKTTTVTTPT